MPASASASNNHYDTEAFAQWAGIKLVHIPNKGGGAAITNDVVSGDAHVAWINAASSAGVIKGGLLKPLAVMADARLPEYPDVPTLKELGYASGKGLWSALYAPAKTPRGCARDHSQGDGRGAELRAGAGGVQEADDQAGAERLDRRRQGVERQGDRALEARWPRR